jgi:hypothetical protein
VLVKSLFPAAEADEPTRVYRRFTESLLTFSGAELSGNVEPQEPCMTVTLRKNE